MSLPHLVHDVRTAVVVKRDRLIRLQEVLRLAGVGKSTWYALMKTGDAPKGIQLTKRCTAWSENAILTWVQNRLDSANNGQAGLSLEGGAK